MQISKEQHRAAEEMLELIATALGKNRAVHAATAIASCARLAGSCMFRSFNHQMTTAAAGTVVLSEVANEKVPLLINVTGYTLDNLGITIDQKDLEKSVAATSNLGFLETLTLLQHKAAAIMDKNKLDYEQMAYACALSTAFLIKECERDLPAPAGFNTAIYGFIEGSKTYPPEFADTVPKKKSIFTFWK